MSTLEPDLNRDLLAQTDTIVAVIQQSDEAKQFWQAREKMEHHMEAQELFEEIKRKTNQLLAIRETVKETHPKVVALQTELNELESQLATIPVAMQYQELQGELNGLMQEVVQILLTRLTPFLPVELGPKQGCGQGHDGKGCSCGKN